MKGILFSLIPFAVFAFISCDRTAVDENFEEARLLFSKSAELILETTSKINSVNDSLSVDSLINIYNKEITDINFSFPPETDLKLTEQENDSLFKLIESMHKIKAEKLKSLAFVPTDSIIQENVGM
ncbi:MAG: hypothetical protein J1E16_03435 [Muribaculaceae bacterium]|nr:hypothetical protein [Muribaculaceae bacterium]